MKHPKKPYKNREVRRNCKPCCQQFLSLQRNKVKKYLVFLGQNPVPFANRSHLPAVELILQILKLYVGEKAALKDNLLDQLLFMIHLWHVRLANHSSRRGLRLKEKFSFNPLLLQVWRDIRFDACTLKSRQSMTIPAWAKQDLVVILTKALTKTNVSTSSAENRTTKENNLNSFHDTV